MILLLGALSAGPASMDAPSSGDETASPPDIRSFQKGNGGAFSETDDAYIYNGLPNSNYGSAAQLFVDGSGCIAPGTMCKSLIKFPDIVGSGAGQIPRGSTVAHAILEMTLTNAGGPQDVYQVTEAWSESTATWNAFATPGTPGVRGIEFTFAPNLIGQFSIDITSIVQRWADGEANEGILLASTHSDGADFGSSESTSPPILTVEIGPRPAYTPFTFGAVGDLGSAGNPNMVGLSKRLAGADATFLLALGDLGYEDDEAAWCNSVKSGIDDVLILPGNHDAGETPGGGEISEYVRYCPFTLDVAVHAGPGTPGYGYEYYFDYPAAAPLARFILMAAGVHGSLEYDYRPGSAHWNFVVNAVTSARSSGIPWVIVGNHKPCVNVGSAPCEMTRAVFDQLVDLRVDLILQAHSHSYQRSRQLALGPACPTVPPNGGFDADCIVDDGADGAYAKGSGTIVVTSGAGGDSLSRVPLDGSDAELGYIVHGMGRNGNTKGMLNGNGSVVFSVSETGIEARTDFCPAGTTDGTGQCPDHLTSAFHDRFSIGSGAGGPTGPIARFNHTPATPRVNETATFDASSSTSDPGVTLQARWDWEGDGVWDTSRSSSLTAQHAFASAGTNSVRLEVQDSNGLTDTASREVTVVPADLVTLSFRKGDGGAHSETDDTYLYNGAPNTNNGSATQLLVDASGCIAVGTICKSLIKFPDMIGGAADQVPQGSTVRSAVLSIAVADPGGLQDVYQVTEAWDESTATWNGFATPGSPATKSRVTSFTPPFGRIGVDITSVVQNWANGEPNHGILIASMSTNGADYGSSESANRPSLTVEFVRTGSSPPPPPPFDFSVSIQPTSASTAPGGSVSATLTATLTSGSPDNVQWSCANLPSGSSCAFTPPACAPTCSAALSLATSASTPAGTYGVTITATDGAVSRSTEFSLTVAGTSGAPVVLSFRKGDGGPYSETDDAFLYNGAPDNNYGTHAYLYVDAADCIAPTTVCRFVLKFPAFIGPNSGQVAPGSMILSATLQLDLTNAGGTQLLDQVTEGWTESGVTWNAFALPGSPGTKGNAMSFGAPVGVITLNITAIVQNWVNGEPNHGILIRSTSTNGADYRSSESTAPPMLTVTFRSPPPPPGMPAPILDPPASGGSMGDPPTSPTREFRARPRDPM